jgi:hypothetical protein
MNTKVAKLSQAVRGKIRRMLADDPDFYVPIRKLFAQLVDEWPGEYPDFERAVRAEPGLVVEEAHDRDLEPGEARDLEKIGFYQGPRARLRERVPTYGDIMGILKRHTSRMLDSLGQAYGLAADQLSAEEEDMMLDLLQNAKQLRTAVEELGKKGEGPAAGKGRKTKRRDGRKGDR